ncbi:glycosyltransferase family 2 protein [Actinoplanes sp. TBRC 11911]|uniref:glycosyltransferase family 2 protein n=1 Tax=Actinoplanes sp. TBRC 11911 TaxID=2729386 RepID=UPI00145EBB40|nr:glycosyltransferase family 2 protein [Actinoplanes sp. TBRC 11911]NMO52871.1 glycosyltransferase family 2 protein [Actinoplanes sp. TBRC 11911]
MQQIPRRRRLRHSSTAAGPAHVDVRAGGTPRVSVIVPALNEALNLPHVLSGLPPVDEVILVDGGSVDDTVAVARRLRPGIRVVHQTRRGKGNALACGFAAATGDIIVMIDADGSTDPAEIPRFLTALRDGADFAKGSRFAPRGGSADITRIRRFGNLGLNALVNMMFRTRYSDLCYGYNAFWADCLPVFDLDTSAPRPVDGSKLWGDGFEIETLLNLRAARAGLKVVEVPSFEHSRIHGTTNLNTVRDGLRVLRTIVREWPRKPRADGAKQVAVTVETEPRRQAVSK